MRPGPGRAPRGGAHRVARLRRAGPCEENEALDSSSDPEVDGVAVCVDGSQRGEQVLPHARAVARALGAPLTVLRVVERRHSDAFSPDPVEWDLRRRETEDYVHQLAEESGADGPVESAVLEGRASEQICLWAGRHGIALTALSTHGEGGQTDWPLASTTRQIVEGAPGSVLLVPARAAGLPSEARYRRVLVPVDGSSRAESVLPLASRIARAHGAELLLVHVVPEPELTEIGPPDPEAVELRDRLVERNERVAHAYLDRLRAQLADEGLPVRALVHRGGDTASRLARLAADEAADLVVMASHGRSSRADVSLGSVAAYLVTHTEAPLLLVRVAPGLRMQRVRRAPREAPRLPSQAEL